MLVGAFNQAKAQGPSCDCENFADCSFAALSKIYPNKKCSTQLGNTDHIFLPSTILPSFTRTLDVIMSKPNFDYTDVFAIYLHYI